MDWLMLKADAKVDVSENGSGWSDERIPAVLKTGSVTVLCTRCQLVEEELESVVFRKKKSGLPP